MCTYIYGSAQGRILANPTQKIAFWILMFSIQFKGYDYASLTICQIPYQCVQFLGICPHFLLLCFCTHLRMTNIGVEWQLEEIHHNKPCNGYWTITLLFSCITSNYGCLYFPSSHIECVIFPFDFLSPELQQYTKDQLHPVHIVAIWVTTV